MKHDGGSTIFRVTLGLLDAFLINLLLTQSLTFELNPFQFQVVEGGVNTYARHCKSKACLDICSYSSDTSAHKTKTTFQHTPHILVMPFSPPDDPQVAGTPTFSPVSSPHKGLPPRPPSHSRPPPPQSLEGLRHLHYQRSDYDKSPIKPRMWSESSLDEPYERVKKRSSHSRCAPIRYLEW